MAEPDVDLSAIEHLDWPTPCNQCGKPAEVLVTIHTPCVCRVHTYVMCRPCLEVGLAETARRPVPRRCRTCGQRGIFLSARMISWEPLGGAR